MALRLDPELVDRADALVDHVAAKLGKLTTRADVFRLAMVRGLRELEREANREDA